MRSEDMNLGRYRYTTFVIDFICSYFFSFFRLYLFISTNSSNCYLTKGARGIFSNNIFLMTQINQFIIKTVSKYYYVCVYVMCLATQL